MKWNNDRTISIVPPVKPKKCTGTRFAAILGANVWSTPFNAWCAITRTYEEPFEDTKYTIAGKTIEPKQAEWMAGKYFWRKLVKPADIWGEDYFKKTYGDFFPDNKIYGGMWDYLFVDRDGAAETVLEMKTTKRAEDWKNGIPEYYALQAALYAWLLGVDDVIMVCTILDEKDYDLPEAFVVNAQNTFEKAFKVSEKYPHFENLIHAVDYWWEEHVVKGVSPDYDEKRDEAILKALRKNTVTPETSLTQLINEAEEIKERLNKAAAETADDEKRLKVLTDMIKEIMGGEFREGDKQVSVPGDKYDWVYTRSYSMKVDEDALKADGLLDKYKTKETVTYRLTPKVKGEK